MNFMEAWRAAGYPRPGRTTWSADVDGRPVFTAWRGRDLGFDRQTRRSTFNSPPGSWVDEARGKSYLDRARQALSEGWACRLILLEGEAPWARVRSAAIDPTLYAVRFTQVQSDGFLQGHILTALEYQDDLATPR